MLKRWLSCQQLPASFSNFHANFAALRNSLPHNLPMVIVRSRQSQNTLDGSRLGSAAWSEDATGPRGAALPKLDGPMPTWRPCTTSAPASSAEQTITRENPTAVVGAKAEWSTWPARVPFRSLRLIAAAANALGLALPLQRKPSSRLAECNSEGCRPSSIASMMSAQCRCGDRVYIQRPLRPPSRRSLGKTRRRSLAQTRNARHGQRGSVPAHSA